MTKRDYIEVLSGAITLGVSLWVAFGPLRHRLPRFLTRLAKYSVALKLTFLSGLCWWGWWQNKEIHGYHALRWGLFALAIGLLGGAAYVLTLKQTPKRAVDTPPPPPNPPGAGGDRYPAACPSSQARNGMATLATPGRSSAPSSPAT